MGQIAKRIAFSGLLAIGSCGVSHAQSGWNWPTRDQQPSAAPPLKWAQMPPQQPSLTPPAATGGLFGPSDFQQLPPPTSPSANSRESGPATQLPSFSWNAAAAKRAAATQSSAEHSAAVVKQVAWDAALGRASVNPPRPAAEQPPAAANAQSFNRPQPTFGLITEVDMPGTRQAPRPAVEAPRTPTVASAKPAPSQATPPATPPATPSAIVAAPAPSLGIPGLATETPSAELPSSAAAPASLVAAPVSSTTAAPRTDSQPTAGQFSLIPLTAAPPTAAAQVKPQANQLTPAQTDAEPLNYVLQDVGRPPAAAQANQESLIPISVLPFNRLISTNPTSVGTKEYSTEEMTGPLVEPTLLFSKLHIENDFRQVPGVAASAVRMEADASGFGPEWMYSNYTWVSPSFYHKPLYFEQVNMERYGLGPRPILKPVYSAAHFFGSIGLMPYKLLTQHPCEKVYTLGHQRPGDCVAFQRRSLIGQSYPLEAMRYFHNYSGYK